MAMVMAESIVGLVVILMLVLIILFILLACRPWRFFFSSPQHRQIKVGDLERPLISDDIGSVQSQVNDLPTNQLLEVLHPQAEENISSPRTQGLACKQKLPSTDEHSNQGANLVLDVISDPSEDVPVGHTIKRTLVAKCPVEERKHVKRERTNNQLPFISENDSPQEPGLTGSSLSLEVISGPSCGLRCSLLSTNTAKLPVTLGRVSPSDLLVKDSEVSGKHALINWNTNKLKWELVDMGSLNGTLLNSQAVQHPDSGSRHKSEPFELASGDIITLGTTSKVSVEISPLVECQIPFGVGVASDSMALRRGGRKLPMEDVCYYQWPLPGVEQFGLFGICDGHGGAEASKAASKIFPEMVANILSVSEKRQKVLSLCDASDVLRDAFCQTEASMNHQYEGCTATVLLVWAHGPEDFFAQCANVGDSACFVSIGGKQIKMTEDHRITNKSERIRLNETGEPLRDGETRLCGMNLARMLGDKFLKEQDLRFTSEPYISQVVHIEKASKAFALLASDGLWDVISIKKAMQLVFQMRDNYSADGDNFAEKVANFILDEARSSRTKDNTSIIFVDFATTSTSRTDSCKSCS